jgi:hypothetical protein
VPVVETITREDVRARLSGFDRFMVLDPWILVLRRFDSLRVPTVTMCLLVARCQ